MTFCVHKIHSDVFCDFQMLVINKSLVFGLKLLTHISVTQVQYETVLDRIHIRVHSDEQADRRHGFQVFQVGMWMNLH